MTTANDAVVADNTVENKSEIEAIATTAVDEIVTTAANVAAIKQSDSMEHIEDATNDTQVPMEVPSDEPQSIVAVDIAHVQSNGSAEIQVPHVVRQPSPARVQPAPAVGHHTPINQHLELASDGTDPMTASMIKRVSTAEEAKAALAERRRLAREEAERLAELERQRQEEEERAEEQRQAEEEERQRRFEEETLHMVEEQRKAEELRLSQAIEEAGQREQEERQRRADEELQRAERERDELKAREEAERQKIEVAERLKKEEKEREERRKRVEAIMSRTRAKGAAAAAAGGAATNATPSKVNVGIIN